MRRALTGALLAAALTLGAVAPAHAAGSVLVAPSAVAITGAARDGGTLAVDVAAVAWGDVPEAVTVQWLRDGVAIPSATGATYAVRSADVGHRVAVRLTASGGGAQVVAESAPRTAQPGVTSERRLRTRLAALLPDLPGRYTLQVRELDGGRRTVSIGAAAHREPASTVKVFIAYGVYRRIDAGALRYTDRVSSGLTVRACLEAMIEPSDNFCAAELRARIGNAWLNRLLAKDGFRDTHFWYAGGRTKTTSAADVTTLLSRLARGTLLSRSSSAAFLRLLETQVWREAIPPGLPLGTRQASKPGTVWTGSGMVQTDAAIVWGKRSRYVLTVLGSNGATIPSITRITRVVQRELQGPTARSFVYDRQQMRATGTLRLTQAVSRSSRLLGTFRAGTRVEVIDSIRTRYLVRIGGRVGWIDNTHLVLRDRVL